MITILKGDSTNGLQTRMIFWNVGVETVVPKRDLDWDHSFRYDRNEFVSVDTYSNCVSIERP